MLEAINEFYKTQFQTWNEAKKNYEALNRVRRRTMTMGDLPVSVQCNPARARSTSADVSAKTISERPCFLCAKNRPKEQLAGTAIPDFEILINPYPILPVHFTIASKEHAPQSAMPLEMVDFVNMLPLCAAFFNGASAGASAPDHLHFQAVLKEELPLLHQVELRHTHEMAAVVPSADLGDFPMGFISIIIRPDLTGMELLASVPKWGGVTEDAHKNSTLVNNIVWKDSSGLLRILVFPRKTHRPKCYHSQREDKRLVSPGALDMAGLIITPAEGDFERLTASEIQNIYEEVGLTPPETRQYCSQPEIAPFTNGEK